LDWVAASATLATPPSPAIRVVNMSLGREASADPVDDLPMRAAVQGVCSKGIAVVVAAGNDAKLEVSQQVPSGFPEVIAVGSTTAKAGTNAYRFYSGVIGADTASYFTSDGAYNANGIGVTVSAPGEDQEDITKAGFIQSVGILSTKLGGGTTRMSGTSMASPHVAGVAALLYEKYPSSTVEDIRRRISVGAVRQGIAPIDSPSASYTPDGDLEGILSAPGALAQP
jgi:subtilisin family serine protease